MNDNATLPVPATTIAPQVEIKENEVYKQVEALLDLWKDAQSYEDLNVTFENPILKNINPETLLITIAACLNMALPGAPLYARGVGIVTLTFPGGQIAPAVALELFPGKQVLFAMHRETAESFEKILKAAVDEHFGRIIRP